MAKKIYAVHLSATGSFQLVVYFWVFPRKKGPRWEWEGSGVVVALGDEDTCHTGLGETLRPKHGIGMFAKKPDKKIGRQISDRTVNLLNLFIHLLI